MPGPFRLREAKALLQKDKVSSPTVYAADGEAILFTDSDSEPWTAWLHQGQIIGYDHGFLVPPA